MTGGKKNAFPNRKKNAFPVIGVGFQGEGTLTLFFSNFRSAIWLLDSGKDAHQDVLKHNLIKQLWNLPSLWKKFLELFRKIFFSSKKKGKKTSKIRMFTTRPVWCFLIIAVKSWCLLLLGSQSCSRQVFGHFFFFFAWVWLFFAPPRRKMVGKSDFRHVCIDCSYCFEVTKHCRSHKTDQNTSNTFNSRENSFWPKTLLL